MMMMAVDGENARSIIVLISSGLCRRWLTVFLSEHSWVLIVPEAPDLRDKYSTAWTLPRPLRPLGTRSAQAHQSHLAAQEDPHGDKFGRRREARQWGFNGRPESVLPFQVDSYQISVGPNHPPPELQNYRGKNQRRE